jgi:hypothetical protein
VQDAGDRKRYCVQVVGSTAGKWVNEAQLCPGPLWQVKTWQFVAPVLRCIVELPRSVLRVIHDLQEPKPPTSPTGADRSRGARSASLGDACESMTTLLLEHDLNCELTASWLGGLVEQVEEMAPHLLHFISQVFSSRLGNRQQGDGVGQGGVGDMATKGFRFKEWIDALSPVMSDLCGFTMLCLAATHRGRSTELSMLVGLHRSRSESVLAHTHSPEATRRRSTPTSPFGSSQQQVLSPVGLTPADRSNPEDIPKRFATVVYNVCNNFYIELKVLTSQLRRLVTQCNYPSDMRTLSGVLAFMSFVRRSWNQVTHRLHLATVVFEVEEVVTRISCPIIWRVNNLLNDFQSSLLERGTNLVMHWCRTYIFQSLHAQDWDSEKEFMEDKRCSYGVQAWSLYMRGLFFDFKDALYQSSTGSEARELLASILAQCVGFLSAKYYTISPSRIRLPQYVSDIASIVVTSLSLAQYLRKDPILARGNEQTKGWGSDEIPSTSNRVLEAAMRDHDSSHQNALMSLKLTDHYCWGMMSLLTLLLAPPDVLVWYFRIMKPPQMDTLSPAWDIDEFESLKLRNIEEALINVDMNVLNESFREFMELSQHFNPITENQKIGATRESDQTGQLSQSGGGRTAMIGTGYGLSLRATSTIDLFGEAYVGKRVLENIQLKWKEVLSSAPQLTHMQIATLVRRRYELNASERPPLDPDEQERATVLKAALAEFEDRGAPAQWTPQTPKSPSPFRKNSAGGQGVAQAKVNIFAADAGGAKTGGGGAPRRGSSDARGGTDEIDEDAFKLSTTFTNFKSLGIT